MSGFKISSWLIILGIILVSLTGYAIGQSPIAGLENTINQIETENIALLSQVEELNEDNKHIQDLLVATLANLTATQSAYQNLFEKYLSVEENLTEIQYGFGQLLTGYEEVKNQIEDIEFSNTQLLTLYSSLWEKYCNLIIAYNNLTSDDYIGEMTFTRIPGVVNGEFNEGGGWIKQGKGGQGPPYADLWQYPSSTYLIQNVVFSSINQGIVFDFKPAPYGASVDFHFSIDEITVYSETYSGVNDLYDWQEVVIPFAPIYRMKQLYGFDGEGVYEIRFTIEAGEDNGARVLIDNVSLIEIRYIDYPCDMRVNEGLEFEIMYDGVVEWTNEVSYDNYDIIKLVIPEGARESSGAIVKSPLNIPFSSLESFSYFVSFESARPRFRIYLDTNGDDVVDTILRSDYQDYGTGEWGYATGGLRWGWGDPIGPWASLAYWRDRHSDAQILYVGLYLEYWGVHPEGIGEPLYVVNYVCVNTLE